MRGGGALTLVRVASIVVVLAAIVWQAVDLARHDAFDPSRFFAYFTVQSNLIGVVAFGWLLARRRVGRTRALESFRGAASAYLVVTFTVVILLLSDADVGLAVNWVDFVLHKAFPVVVMLDWLLDPPTVRLDARDAVAWTVYPIAWTVVTMVRGALDGWYPYPFLDPAGGGYGPVALTIAAITIGFLGLAAALVGIGNRRSQASGPPRPSSAGSPL